MTWGGSFSKKEFFLGVLSTPHPPHQGGGSGHFGREEAHPFLTSVLPPKGGGISGHLAGKRARKHWTVNLLCVESKDGTVLHRKL
jgi:hypothetical protein